MLSDADDQHCMFYERDGIVDRLRTYLLTVIVAALICSILTALPGKNSTVQSLRKTLCGIFMAVTLLSPIVDLQLPDLQNYLDAFRWDAAQAVDMGQSVTRESLAQLIKQQTAAYILDKAVDMGAEVEVEVTLSDDSTQVPCAVTITGMVSPYLKQRLSEMIEEDLQIKREDQHWINKN